MKKRPDTNGISIILRKRISAPAKAKNDWSAQPLFA